jgi:hypothetical protein
MVGYHLPAVAYILQCHTWSHVGIGGCNPTREEEVFAVAIRVIMNTYDATYGKLVILQVGKGGWLEASEVDVATRYGTVLEVGSLTVAA